MCQKIREIAAEGGLEMKVHELAGAVVLEIVVIVPLPCETICGDRMLNIEWEMEI